MKKVFVCFALLLFKNIFLTHRIIKYLVFNTTLNFCSLKQPADFKKRYLVDEVHYVEEVSVLT